VLLIIDNLTPNGLASGQKEVHRISLLEQGLNFSRGDGSGNLFVTSIRLTQLEKSPVHLSVGAKK